MDQPFDFEAQGLPATVYVRAMAPEELPGDVLSTADEETSFYGVYSEEGEPLAIVPDRTLAFVVARQNALRPVSVH